MEDVQMFTHDSRELEYRVRVRVIAEIVDNETGDVVASGDENSIKRLYRFLKKRSDR